MELCTFDRRLAYKKAVSKEVASTCTAILAGLGVATDLMFLKLVRPLDKLQLGCEGLSLYVVADDLRLGMQHKDEHILAARTTTATQKAIELLEDEEHMQVSRGEGGKTIAMASTTSLHKRMGVPMKRKGISTHKEQEIWGWTSPCTKEERKG